jgi:hypothetical protein
MGRLILLLGFVALTCMSCTYQRRDTTLYQSTGRQKAIAVVLPVIDSTGKSQLSWDLSQEFTEEIRKRIYESPKVYLLRDSGSKELAQQFTVPHPTAIPVRLTNQIGAAEFVIATELMSQTETPYGLANDYSDKYPIYGETGSVLSVAMRVRVIDVRGETPQVVLQEILTHDQHVARPYMNPNYDKTPWGTEAFQYSAMGIVHHRLVNELVARVEGYIEAIH